MQTVYNKRDDAGRRAETTGAGRAVLSAAHVMSRECIWYDRARNYDVATSTRKRGSLAPSSSGSLLNGIYVPPRLRHGLGRINSADDRDFQYKCERVYRDRPSGKLRCTDIPFASFLIPVNAVRNSPNPPVHDGDGIPVTYAEPVVQARSITCKSRQRP